MPKLSDFKPGDPVFTRDGKRATVACVHEDCLYLKASDGEPLGGNICALHGGEWTLPGMCESLRDNGLCDGSTSHKPLRRAPFLDKPAKEQDIDVTRKFVVLKEQTYFDVGDILVLKRDDSTRNPWFELAGVGGCRRSTGDAPAWWIDLAYADEPEEEKRPDPAVETKIAVHVPTRGQYDALMTAYERKGWYALGKTCWDSYKGETCVRTTSPSKSNYASRSWYEKEGYSIITFDEAMRRLVEPVEEKQPVSPVEEKCPSDCQGCTCSALGTRAPCSHCEEGHFEERERPKSIADVSSELVRIAENLYASNVAWSIKKIEINPKQQKPIIMENIVQKIKDLALSKDDRILRADGFEDQCGKPTPLAKDMMLAEILEERWAERRADVAKSLSEIAKEDKK